MRISFYRLAMSLRVGVGNEFINGIRICTQGFATSMVYCDLLEVRDLLITHSLASYHLLVVMPRYATCQNFQSRHKAHVWTLLGYVRIVR